MGTWRGPDDPGNSHEPRSLVTAPVTVHAGLDILLAIRRRDPRQVIHAILGGPACIGGKGPLSGVTRAAGEPVCGEPSQFGEPPAALWGHVITCASCAVIVRAEGIELTGCSP
jgi:hypothetical protein